MRLKHMALRLGKKTVPQKTGVILRRRPGGQVYTSLTVSFHVFRYAVSCQYAVVAIIFVYAVRKKLPEIRIGLKFTINSTDRPGAVVEPLWVIAWEFIKRRIGAFFAISC